MPEVFPYDVFLSHSAKDKALVRPLAERLRADGIFNSSQPSTFNSQLPPGPFRFRDPLNKERRFLPPRLDDAPSKDSGWFRKDDDVRWQPSGARQPERSGDSPAYFVSKRTGQIAKGNPQGERGGVHQFGVPPKGNANFASRVH